MPIDTQTLDAIARTFVVSMTPIRGRRVHRLLKREFSRFDHVIAAVTEDGAPALLALAQDGRVALCRADGRGATAGIAGWARLPGATVTTFYDMTKDSLPVVHWTIWHPGFSAAGGTLTIRHGDCPVVDHHRWADLLREWLR